MARYAYDVNTTQRYIDVHKQFQGGLKTVDTDDSLGAVFLRDAENVSLSEFGFIEKRYGTYENFKAGLPVTSSSNLQGYWEFLNKYIIIALDGKIYYQLLSNPTQSFSTFTQFNTVDTLDYPTNLAEYLGLESDFSVGSGFNGFQSERKMGAVNLSDILYIFTGKYPIYIVEEAVDEVLTLKAYLFAKDEPTYPEIVVTGHNLMENDYEGIYYNSKDSIEFPSTLSLDSLEPIQTKESNFVPKLPYAKNGTLDFEISYDVKPELLVPFTFDLNAENEITRQENLRRVSLQSVQYRPSGPGANDFSFNTVDANTYTSVVLDNLIDGADYNINIEDLDGFSEDGFFQRSLEDNNDNQHIIGQETVKTLPVYYWEQSKVQYVEDYFPNKDGVEGNGIEVNAVKLVRKEDEDFLNVKYKDIEIEVHEGITLLDDTQIAPGAKLGFTLKNTLGQTIVLEDNIANAKATLSRYLSKDPRQRRIFTDIKRSNTPTSNPVLFYTVYYQAIENFPRPRGPINELNSAVILYSIAYTDTIQSRIDFPTGIGNAKIIVKPAGVSSNYLSIETYKLNGDLLYTHTVRDGNNNLLVPSYLDYSLPLPNNVRQDFEDILKSPSTRIEIYEHANTSGHDETLLKTYTLGVDLEHKDGKYYFTIPDGGLVTTNHYSLKFKTRLIGFEKIGLKEVDYREQKNPPNVNDSKFIYGITPSSIDDNLKGKKLYPPLFFFGAAGPNIISESFSPLIDYNLTLFPIQNLGAELQTSGQLGSELLKVSIKQGLVSGTYDFKFNFRLDTDLLNDQFEKQSESVYNFFHIVKDVTITEEKLQDYTFFEGDRAHPIWTCNQVIEHFNKLLVYGSEEMPNSVFYSFPDRPFYFPDKFYLDFTNEKNDPVISVTPYMNILVVQSEECTWGIRGNSGLLTAPSPYTPFTINPNVGTIAPASVRPVRNHLFFLSRQGIVALKSLYAVDETYNIDFMDLNIRNIVPQDSDAVGIQFDNQYWLNFPNFGITLRWYIDKKAWVLDRYGSYTDLTGKKIEKTGSWEDFRGVFKYQIRDGKLEFITNPSVYDTQLNIHKIGVDYSLPTDLDKAVVAKLETSFLNQNYPFHPKNYKEAKLDFTIQNEYNITKGFIYEMEDNEDITGDSVHFLNDIPVLPNHFYKLKYDFSPQYNITDGGTFSAAPSETYDGGEFTNNEYPILGNLVFRVLKFFLDGGSFETAPTNVIDAGDFGPALENVITSYDNFDVPLFDIDESFSHLSIDSITIRDYSSQNAPYVVNNLQVVGDEVTFQLPNEVKNNEIDIVVEGNFINYIAGANVYDTTYEDKLVFKTWVISENQTLNFDNIESYDQAKADLDIDLNDKLGTWVFGTSDFGKKVTAVKTIKLSGKGYNSKIYMEDYSKSKWTLESMGITYKMKRARSR